DGLLRRMWPARRKAGHRPGLSVGLLVCALSGLLAGGSAASAGAWVVDSQKSTLSFEAVAGGQKVQGRFERFTTQIEFEPADPSKTRIEVNIDTGSAATGQSQVDQALKGTDWFDVARFPKARFRAAEGRRAADGRFELVGELTIRGVTQPVVVAFALEQKGRQAAAHGEATVDRSRFGIGPATVAGMVLGNDVVIRLEIRAARSQ
ncbi:MAG: YceI family protein, partial [Methyloligellaceae bacterium]